MTSELKILKLKHELFRSVAQFISSTILSILCLLIIWKIAFDPNWNLSITMGNITHTTEETDND